MRFGWTSILILIWVYRSAYSVVGQVLVAGLTTLGDSSQFQSGLVREDANLDVTDVTGIRTTSTVITELVGRGFYVLFNGNPILINIGFQTIAFIGIALFLMALKGQARLISAILLMMPTFTLWSSIASKEAIIVFAVGFLAAYIIKLYRHEPRSTFMMLACIAIVLIYKNQYLPALLFLMVGTWLCARVRQSDFLVLSGLLLSIGLLYLVRHQFADLAFSILPHFAQGDTVDYGRLTREPFWDTPAEVFRRAPYGMFLAFFGPTPEEASVGLLQRVAFLESSLLIGILVVVFIWRLPHLPVYSLVMGLGSLFWIMLPNYPLGVMNPGSAIRYRTGYEILVVLVIVFVLSRDTYIGWRRTATYGGSSKPLSANAE